MLYGPADRGSHLMIVKLMPEFDSKAQTMVIKREQLESNDF